MKFEIWKDISNYEGFYQISNKGRVRSLDRTVYFKNGNHRDYKGKILKQKYHNGYAMINLNKNKKMETLYIHKLVAQSFLDNPLNLKVINHKNGIKIDNCVENLEWCTFSYNNKHAIINNLRTNNINGLLETNNKNKKRIALIKDNKILVIKDCSRELAIYLLENKLINNASIETIARTIRKSANMGKSYHSYFFQFIED